MSNRNERQILCLALSHNLDSLFPPALRLVGSRETAEDFAQEGIRKALEGVPRLRDQQKARAWIFKILVNCVRDHFRRRRDWEEFDSEAKCGEVHWAIPAIAQATVHDVRQAPRELGAPRRAVVVLIDIEDFAIAEAADILCFPMGTAASRLVRTRQDLRSRLRACQPQIADGGGTS